MLPPVGIEPRPLIASDSKSNTGGRGRQLVRLKVAGVANPSCSREASNPRLGPGSFWVFNAQISIPLRSRGSLLTSISTSNKIINLF